MGLTLGLGFVVDDFFEGCLFECFEVLTELLLFVKRGEVDLAVKSGDGLEVGMGEIEAGTGHLLFGV